MIEEPASHYRPDIDGLRAFAVLAVLAFHGYPQHVPGGFVGVDVFFVISGYLISRVIVADLAQERFTISRFYARRIRRIFPAVTLMLLIATIAAWAFLLPDAWERFGRDSFASSAFFANLQLAWERSDYFTSGFLRPLVHLWSLGVEEQFYFVWPLLLFLLRKRSVRTSVVVLASIASLSFALNVVLVTSHQTLVFYLPVTRIWELALGSLLAISNVRLSGWRSNAASAAGFAICAGAVAFTTFPRFPGVLAIAPTAGPALIIAAGPAAWLNRKVLAARGAVAIGLISYPLYLWHWPLLSAVRLACAGPVAPWLIAACIAAAFVLAALTWRYVETPVRSAPVTSPQLRIVSAVLVVVAVAGAAAAWSFRRACTVPRSTQRYARPTTGLTASAITDFAPPVSAAST